MATAETLQTEGFALSQATWQEVRAAPSNQRRALALDCDLRTAGIPCLPEPGEPSLSFCFRSRGQLAILRQRRSKWGAAGSISRGTQLLAGADQPYARSWALT